MKTKEMESKLKDELEKIGFVHRPDLPGNPEFAHFERKTALLFRPRREPVDYERFKKLRSIKWKAIAVVGEDGIKESLNRIKGFMLWQDYAKYSLPPGPESTVEKLIGLLGQTETEIAELKKSKKRVNLGGLGERRRKIGQDLHHHLKPVVLKRDGHKCRACGSTDNLELVRLYGGIHLVPIKETYYEKNMFILCKRCHKILDGFFISKGAFSGGTPWRDYQHRKGRLSIESAVEFVRNPLLAFLVERHKQWMKRALRLIKALKKAIIFSRVGDMKKSRLYVGLAKRELNFMVNLIEKIPQEQYTALNNKIQLIRENIDSGRGAEHLVNEISQSLTQTLKKEISKILRKEGAHKLFVEFEKKLENQDRKLLYNV